MIYLSHILPIYVANELTVRVLYYRHGGDVPLSRGLHVHDRFCRLYPVYGCKENFLHRRKKTV